MTVGISDWPGSPGGKSKATLTPTRQNPSPLMTGSGFLEFGFGFSRDPGVNEDG